MDIKRLEQFMLVMLSSDQSGEVAAASAMLKRELKKGGKDIHWLKDNLLQGGNGAGSSDDYRKLTQAMYQLGKARADLAEAHREIDRLRIVVLRAKPQPQSPPYEDMSERARRRNTNNNWYEDREDKSYSDDPPPDTVERIHIASWCLGYLSGNPSLVKNQREHDFIQDMARHHGVLSYAQETWLMDVFDRLRRHHSMMSEGG